MVLPMTDPAMLSRWSTAVDAVPEGDGHERFVAAAGSE